MNLTEEQILALAPDAASEKAGRGLATPGKWVSRGMNEKALWGECQGSGSKPYQTGIDLGTVSFKCSCPSRKFPCKHGLGLLLYQARQPADFTTTDMPDWVAQWIDKRTEKQEKAASKTEASPAADDAAQARRKQARDNKVTAGVAELLVWLQDLVRNGILSVPEKEYTFFDGMARRMVDAQAPGLAGLVRGLGQIPFYKEGWQSAFMEGVAKLYLAITGYQHLAKLRPALQQEVRSVIGFTQNTEELKTGAGIRDHWLMLGRQTTEEDNLTTERNWLYGTTTGHYALVLQFLVRGQPAGILITPGTCIDAELVFFPAVVPLRAIVRQQHTRVAVPAPVGFANWQQVADYQTMVSSHTPFSGNRPYIVHGLTPVFYQDQWYLQDATRAMMPLPEAFAVWKLLACSGGAPMTVALTGRAYAYEPLGIWHEGNYKLL